MSWNDLRHFHKRPQVIATWRRGFGPILRWLTPGRRRLLLGLGALIVAIRIPYNHVEKAAAHVGVPINIPGLILLILVLLGFVFLCYTAAKNFSSLPDFVRRRPQIWLHAIFWVLLGVVWTVPISHPILGTVLFGCILVLPYLLWRIGYTLYTSQRGKMKGTQFTDHLAYIFPVWGGSDTPYGKGFDYLSANEAKDEEALAKSQLSGLKLFLLAALWSVSKDILDGVVFGKANVSAS